MRIAVLGLGEAGHIYAEGFAELGADVSGFDPAAQHGPAGVRLAASIADAVADADIVLSLVGAAASTGVLRSALEAMPATAVFADLNTAAPEHKVRLAEEAGGAGISFADIAIMAPVPRAGVRSPVLVSGVGADRITDVWSELGIPISNVGPIAGGAAGLKMLRSVFMKGLAALVFEGVSAAEKVNASEWMRAQMASELGVNGAALVDRLIGGTRIHAQRRELEMHDVREYLGTLEVPTWMTEATTEWLHALAEDPYFPGGPLVS